MTDPANRHGELRQVLHASGGERQGLCWNVQQQGRPVRPRAGTENCQTGWRGSRIGSTGCRAHGIHDEHSERPRCHDFWLSRGRLECRRAGSIQSAVTGKLSILLLQHTQRLAPWLVRSPFQEQLPGRAGPEVLRGDLLPAGMGSRDDEDVGHVDGHQESVCSRRRPRRRMQREAGGGKRPRHG